MLSATSSLRPFNLRIIFQDDKKDENKVIANAHIHVSPPLPCAKVNATQRTKQYSI